jgi:membrane-associated phospholipid phosphatase
MRFLNHITLVIGLFAATNVSAQSPYQLRTGREIAIFGIGAATGVSALVLEKQLNPLTSADINALDRSTINSFDRGATYRFSHTADQLSDVTLAGNVALIGALTLGTPTMRQEVKTIGVMFLETALLANGVQRSVKNIVQRTRPYAYNPDAPLADKLDRETRQSFFSGHATNAFAAAVFTGTTFSHYFPTSRYRPLVWVGSLGLASATAVLRYEGGKHFPTDLIAGAAFGSLVGWGIPKLHEVKQKSPVGRRLDIQPFSNGQANGIYARLLVFSR